MSQTEVSKHEEAGANGATLQGGSSLHRPTSVVLSNEQFEELYLQPKIRSSRQAASIKTFGNPTPIGIICFVLTLLPTSCVLMNFRQTTAAESLIGLIGVHYGVGGIGMVLAGIGEFVIGNSFPSLVFFTFGVFWLSLGFFLDPAFGIAMTLGDNFAVPFGFYLITWGVYTLFLTIASVRTNAVLVTILLFVALTFLTLGIGYLRLADGSMTVGSNLLTTAGAFGFAASVVGMYLELNLAMSTTDWKILPPLFDLSHLFRD